MKTITRFLTVCCLFSLASYSGFAQISLFSKVIYDPQGAVQAYCVEKTMDHNFIIAGEENNNAFALKIDTTGSILWSKTIGNNGGTFYCLTVTRDSCFVLAGFAYNQGDTASELLCVKINSAGDTLWTRMIKMGFNDEVLSIRQTLDNGFILTGDASGEKIVVVKLDASGNLSWGKLFSVDNYKNLGRGADQTPDTGYIITGYTENSTNYVQTMYLMKLTSTGTVSWIKQLNYQNSSVGHDALVVNGGIMNYLTTSNEGMILIKTDFSGNVLWSKSYNAGYGYQLDPASFRLHQTSENGYIFVTGIPFSPSTIKVDSIGNVLFSFSLVLIPTDEVEFDEGAFIVGNGPIIGTKQKQNTNPQVGVIKTDTSGNGSTCVSLGEVVASDYSASFSDITCTSQSSGTAKHLIGPVTYPSMNILSGCVDFLGGVNEHKNPISINVFPIPNNGHFNVTITTASEETFSISIYNTLGVKIYEETKVEVNGSIQKIIDLGPLPNGVYTIIFKNSQNQVVKKIIVNK
ncbi:MAG: T9SS type A sorting domain-containing protein [Bacteroidales bacterium]|jgi:hypothetical protein